MAGWGRRLRIAIKGRDPRNGRGFIWHMFYARPGGGGSPGGDGWHSVGEWHSAGGLKFGSVEVAEVRFPLHIARHEFRRGSGGAGEYRGGCGAELELRVETGGSRPSPTLPETACVTARAAFSAARTAMPHRYIHHGSGGGRVLPSKQVGIEVAPGDVFEVLSGGGGGWGDPARRSESALVEADRLDGVA